MASRIVDEESVGPTLEELGAPRKQHMEYAVGANDKGVPIVPEDRGAPAAGTKGWTAGGMAVNEEPSALDKYWKETADLSNETNQHEVPSSVSAEDRAKYGTRGQQAVAGVEGFARGLSFGQSDPAAAWVAEKRGYPEYARDIEMRRTVNPWTSELGGDAAMAASVGATRVTGKATPKTEPVDWRSTDKPRPYGQPRKVLVGDRQAEVDLKKTMRGAEDWHKDQMDKLGDMPTAFDRSPIGSDPFPPPSANPAQEMPTRADGFKRPPAPPVSDVHGGIAGPMFDAPSVLTPEARARLIEKARADGTMVRGPAKGVVGDWFKGRPQTWNTPEQLAEDAALRRRQAGE
jgi:hypothetical protein